MRPRFWTITGAPFWRDWVAGVFLIAIGWAIYSPQDKIAVALEIILYCIGGLILLAALINGFRAILSRAGGDHPAA